MRIVLAIGAVTAALLGGAPRPAEACSPFFNDPYARDARHGPDAVPPGEVALTGLRFEGWHQPPECPSFAGMLSLSASATDDLSGVDVGFVVHVPGGRLALGDGEPAVPGLIGELVFYLHDTAVPFELEISAVDRAGNVGAATRRTIGEVAWLDAPPDEPPDDDGGCAASRSSSAGLAPLALAALGLAARPRRRR